MQRIVFMSREKAAHYHPRGKAALISIHDKSEEPLLPPPYFEEVLYLRFHDTDGQVMGLEVFNEELARKALDFAEKHEGLDELVVHCQMGVSRSAGIALFLSEKHGVPCFRENAPVTCQTWRIYNRKVYTTLARAEHGEGSAFGAIERTDGSTPGSAE